MKTVPMPLSDPTRSGPPPLPRHIGKYRVLKRLGEGATAEVFLCHDDFKDCDVAIKRVRPDGWRGVQAREQVIKAELYKFLKDVVEVERIFLIIKAQREY